MLRIEVGDWEALQRWAAPIRGTVFVEEQNVPAEMEIDDWDPKSVHAVAFDGDGHGAGDRAPAARRPHRPHGGARSRRAVRASAVRCLTTLMNAARARGHREAVLSAQTHAVPFYRRHGYEICGAEYLDAGIPHVDMKAAL